MFNGKIHYKWPFSIAMLNYQRVSPDQQVLCNDDLLPIEASMVA